MQNTFFESYSSHMIYMVNKVITSIFLKDTTRYLPLYYCLHKYNNAVSEYEI